MSQTHTIVTTLPNVPVTKEHPIPFDLDKNIPNPSIPRASQAVDRDHPRGSAGSRDDRTVLQKHCDFFDRDKDNKVSPKDTFLGFRALGFGYFLSVVAIFIINFNFAWYTAKTWLPTLNIDLDNIHRAKHGSDTEVYDTEGRFVPEKFEEIFSKYDKDRDNALNKTELWELLRGNRNITDPVGWFAAMFEWWFLFWIACENGKISKERIRQQYDGTLFYAIEESVRREREGLKKQQ